MNHNIATGSATGPEAEPFSQLLIPNPELVPQELVERFSDEELKYAAYAYQILHADKTVDEDRLDIRKYSPSIVDLYKTEGIDAVITGFMTLRILAGETDDQGRPAYNGLIPEPIDTQERTSIDDYLGLASNRKIVTSTWDDDHDLWLHLVGVLLSEGPISDLIQGNAKAAKGLDEEHKIIVGDRIDLVTAAIQQIWSRANTIEAGSVIGGMRYYFADIDGQLPPQLRSARQIEAACRSQQRFIEELMAKPVFVLPEAA